MKKVSKISRHKIISELNPGKGCEDEIFPKTTQIKALTQDPKALARSQDRFRNLL